MTIYNPATHEALFGASGSTIARLWATDKMIVDLAHAGVVSLVISQAVPTIAQRVSLWLNPATAGVTEGVLQAWDGAAWVALTPLLFSQHTARVAAWTLI